MIIFVWVFLGLHDGWHGVLLQKMLMALAWAIIYVPYGFAFLDENPVTWLGRVFILFNH